METNACVKIPQPCHEKWHEMMPSKFGRQCAKCDTVVVDFSKLNNEQIITQLNQGKCGRFKAKHVAPPVRLKKWGRIGVAISTIVFFILSGCHRKHIVGRYAKTQFAAIDKTEQVTITQPREIKTMP